MHHVLRLVVGAALLAVGVAAFLYASTFMPDAKATTEPQLVAVGVTFLLGLGSLPLGLGAALMARAFGRDDRRRFIGPWLAAAACLVPVAASVPTIIAVCQRPGGSCG